MTPRSLRKVALIVLLISLLEFAFVGATINVREGLAAPFGRDEVLDSTNHQRISKLYKTSSSRYRYKTQQQHNGIPIFGAHLVFEQRAIDSSVATPVFGTWYPQTHLNNINRNPQISSLEALQIALDSSNITSHSHNNSRTVLYLFPNHEDTPQKDTFYLAYLVQLSSISTNVIVDAHSGEVHESYPSKKGFISACGTGGNDKIGKVSYCGANAFSINDANTHHRPILANHWVQMYDNLNKDYWDKSSASLMRCSSDPATGYYTVTDRLSNGGYCTGCDVFAFTNFIFDMFSQFMDTLPVRDEHIPLKAYVHVGVNWDASNYDDITGSINFGDGDSVRYPLGVIDIVGHEIGHAFSAKTSGLMNTGESGAIDNFYADLVGETAEHLYYGSNDWKVGANSYRSTNGADRYLDAPSIDGVSIDTANDYVRGMNPYYASGIYSKAIYLLNTQYGWSMLDIFTVFSRSNELYWSPYIGFNDALCAAYQSLVDLYATNSTKILSMSQSLTQAFDTVAVHCDRNQTVSNCGTNGNTYCIYKTIKPSLSKDTSFTVPIALESNPNEVAGGVNVTTYFSVRGTSCKMPSISLEYENVDMDDEDEWILVKDHEQNVIERCGDDWHCSIWNTTCIVNRTLGISSINPGNTYTITMNVSPEIGLLCRAHDYVINARLIFKCAQHTPAPTLPEPSTSPVTFAPTLPTTPPTPFTANPTPDPTHQITDCGVHRHCYDVNVYPAHDSDTQHIVSIQNIDESVDVYYDLRFHIIGSDCVLPSISFEYENIDYDQSSEYLAIYDTDDNQVALCSGGGSDCDRFANCVWQFPLSNVLKANSMYNITVMESSHVDALCNAHDWSINARLTMECKAGTAPPTPIPPTGSPLPPTAYLPTTSPTHPTSHPTTRPTAYYSCGFNSVCATVDVMPLLDTDTVWKYTLQYALYGHDWFYHVLFNVKDAHCVNPSISIRYEQIDYDGSNEYFTVIDNDHILNVTCGVSPGAYQCDLFEDCVRDHSLGLNGIIANTTYQVNVFQPKEVDALCTNHSYSINADITLQCAAGTMNPTIHPTRRPSMSPTEPTVDPTPNPTNFRYSCGNSAVNKYCYHLAVYPEIDVDKEWKITIQNIEDNTETYFDIYIVPYMVDCVAPTISFEFERIDYNTRREYILISGFDGFRTTQCGGDGQTNVCGVLETCVTDMPLGINRIKSEDSYIVTVYESGQVEAECKPDSDLSINAILSIKCYGVSSKPTGLPTPEPTNTPTHPTRAPSYKPSAQPTESTNAPTVSPTYDIRSCGAHRYCMYHTISPLQSVDTTFTVPIQREDEQADIFYDIYFISNTLDCIQPSISFMFEPIDYDQRYEYINISDTNGVFLAQCTGDAFSCGTFIPCLDTELHTQTIKPNKAYGIHVVQSEDVDALCFDHDFALNARLSITCHNTQSIVPTEIPTTEPTDNPTKPTVQPSSNPSLSPTIPTIHPTLSPTYLMRTCGLNHYCIYVDLYPNLDITTTHDVVLVHEDISAALHYDVIFTVGNTIECNDPRLSFTFELIDYDQDNEYINITNVDDQVIETCGAISYGQQCGVFVDCFRDVQMGQGIHKVGLSDTYTIGVDVTEEVDALCKDKSDHSYSMNAVLSLSCAKGTVMPTPSPTTPYPTIPTVYPTVVPSMNPTSPTLAPTLSPTWHVLCGTNTWCYHVDITPSLTETTTWTVPIQFDDTSFYGSGSTFRIIYRVTTASTNDCIEPRISLSYETIDYDGDSEYMKVTDTNGHVIGECGIDNPPPECDVFDVCLSDVLLQNKIEHDDPYTITIYQPSTVDSLCSILLNPFSLNASLVLQCQLGSAQPSQEPSTTPSVIPTVPTTAPITSAPTTATQIPTSHPTYDMVYCGESAEERYCVYVAMFPNAQHQTSYSIPIQAGTPTYKQDTIYDIYLTVNNDADCVRPMLSFVFEKIDYDEYDEYINITYTKGNAQQSVLVTQCGAGSTQYDDNDCGEYDVCLNETTLQGVPKIAVHETYKISVIRSEEVGSLCWRHDMAINAELTIVCNEGTAVPTDDPTPSPSAYPTAVSLNPSPRPSLAPSMVTLVPTRSPTYSHQLCESTFKRNKWCYFAAIEPMDDEWSEHMVQIEGVDDGRETEFEITFSAQYIDCVKPSITLKYENIDMDGADEYIQIMDDTHQLVAKCGAIWSCNTFAFCVKNYELNTQTFVAGRNYSITVIEEDEVDGLCTFQSGHSFSINAELTLKCNNGIAKVQQQSDDSGTECGDHKYCFEQIMHPKSIEDTVWQQEIHHLNADEETTQFVIVFVSHNERCYEPKLQFMYERIDFDQSNEFIDIFDNNSVLITRCGAGKVSNECGAFDICLSDGSVLPTRRGFIEMSDEYKITLFESKDVDAMCRHNHSYSMHAFITMSCASAAASTQALSTANMSIDISAGSNTLFETKLTVNKQQTHHKQHITYHVQTQDCLHPTFSVTTHIQVSTKYAQNLWIYNNELDQIGQCISTDSVAICPRSMTCVSQYAVDEVMLPVNATYSFVIYLILDATEWCDDTEDTIHTQLSFECAGMPSVSPTPSAPSETPTFASDISTTASDINHTSQKDAARDINHDNTTNTIVIGVIVAVIVAVCAVCLLGCWCHRRQSKGEVQWKRFKSQTETEMQETNRLSMISPDGGDVETLMTPGDESPYDDETPSNPTTKKRKRKKKKYTPIGDIDTADSFSP
eukprot:71216_1